MRALRIAESVVLLVLRLALAGLFLWAAGVKLAEPQAFADSIKGFKLLPPEGDHLVVLATFVVPWVELVAGLFLLLGVWTRASACVMLLTLLAFIGGIASVLARGISTKCGCFGETSPFCPDEISECNIIQNAILGAVALIFIVRGGGLFSIDGSAAARRERRSRRRDGDPN